MTTIEDRLRDDLPELADALVGTALDEPSTAAMLMNPSPARRPARRAGPAIMAAAAVVGLVVAGLVVIGGRDDGTTGQVPADADAGGWGVWQPVADAPIEPRAHPVTTWTGEEMIVWAGSSLDRRFAYADAAAYDPATDTWRVLDVPGWGHPGLIGVTFGGALYAAAKGAITRLDLAAGTWSEVAPGPSWLLVATDDAVWGIAPSASTTTGRTDTATEIEIARYDPDEDVWEHAASYQASARIDAFFELDAFGNAFLDNGTTALWDGSEIVLWLPGSDDLAFDVETGTWRVLPALEPPEGALGRSIATITDLGLTVAAEIVDAGAAGGHVAIASFDGERWTWLGDGGEPERRVPVSEVATLEVVPAGAWLVLFTASQQPVVVDLATGDLSSIESSPLAGLQAPAAVWTGDELIVWGGIGTPTAQVPRPAQGAIWTPSTDG